MSGARALLRLTSLIALVIFLPATETLALTSSSFEANATEVGGNIYGSMNSASSSFRSVSELCLFCDRSSSPSFNNQEGVIGTFSGATVDPVVARRRESSSYRPIASYCGDAHVNQADEECDDGNRMDGDGCSRSCRIEREADVAPIYPAGVIGGGETPATPSEPAEPSEPIDYVEPSKLEPSKPVIVINPPEKRWDIEEMEEIAVLPKTTEPSYPSAPITPSEDLKTEPELKPGTAVIWPVTPDTVTKTVITEDTLAVSFFPADVIVRKEVCLELAPYCQAEERVTVYTKPVRSYFITEGVMFFPYLLIVLKLLLSVMVAIYLVVLSKHQDE